MNIKNILNEIEQADPAVFEQVSGRRDILKSFGAKVAAVALPFAAASAFNKVSAKTSTGNAIADSLNFMLEICYFEYNFYHTANNTGGLIPSSGVLGNDLAGFQIIEAQEAAHIAFLNGAITTAGGTPYTPKNYNPASANPLFISSAYDFTAAADPSYSPIFANVFNNYATFLIAAQTFEDMGVHAYKGQIPVFMGNPTLLAQIMGLQCDEARHSAHVRLVRRFNNAVENPAPWITNNIPPEIPLQFFYNGEDNVLQNGVTINALPDSALPKSGGVAQTVPQVSATAAFDEALSQSIVTGLFAPFLL